MPGPHAHHHPPATGLTLAYAGIEAGVGWWAGGSLALAADAGHMVNDAAIAARPAFGMA
ncbi:MAG: hypothetical protein ABTR27_08435 [Candidatus Competibacter phosphatis]